MSSVVKRISNLSNIAIILISLTLLSALVLASANISGIPLTVSAEVRESCTISSPTGDTNTFTESIYNSQYKDNIGKSSLTVSCNTNLGFGIYAIGYSNDVLGNNEMITLNSTATNIPTGTATSGNNSQWAMKINALSSGTDTIAITSPFSNYSNIPNNYTKIAEVTNVAGSTASAGIETAYAVYISPTQSPGTYTGKVKYTVVQPPDSKPVAEYNTNAGKIGYYPNAGGVIDSMGDQTAAANTATTLWASNFKRSGFGFAGWSDAYDYVVNTGSPTNPNAKIYGPNETITTPSDLNTNGLSLYAVWVPSAGNLQNWSGCSSLGTGQVTALTDTRDNNTYAIAKLADGNCWMIENLRLGGTSPMTLTSDDTNIASGTTFTLSASQDPTTTAWCTTNYNAACYDQSMVFDIGSTNTGTHTTTPNSNIYSYGSYYNAYSASAGSITSSDSTNNQSSPYSICPIGWRLPKAGDTTSTSNEYVSLSTAIVGLAPNHIWHTNRSSYYGTVSGVDIGAKASNDFRAYPNNFLYSGMVFGDLQQSLWGEYGKYYSSTTVQDNSLYDLSINEDVVYPGMNAANKYYGYSVRCLAN